MDRLEEYLEQVCRRIGGPKEMRKHIRQELQEHLRDAAAQHQAAGLSAEAALAQALSDFGKPEEVRSELEEAHGHRLLAVAIDKAIEWKEMTMKSKWLWTTWAHLAVMGMIALSILWIAFATIFIVPKFIRLLTEGVVDPNIIESQAPWAVSFPLELARAGQHSALLILIAAVAWGFFEWRVRSDNKSFIRLSILGTLAVGFVTVAAVQAGSLLVSFCLGAPATGKLARPFAQQTIARIVTAVSALEEDTMPKSGSPDWTQLANEADLAFNEINAVADIRLVASTLCSAKDAAEIESMQARLQQSRDYLSKVVQAIREKDMTKLKPALKQFDAAFAAVPGGDIRLKH